MPVTPWFRRRPKDIERETQQILGRWLAGEVTPYSRFWAERLRNVGGSTFTPSALAQVPVITEAELSGAGGAGNPALLLSPTEDQFKANASRRELVSAAREAADGGPDGRRDAIWRRYKPVHVHEAGVVRLIAVAYTRSDLELLHLAGARLAEVMGWGAEDALVSLVPAGPSVRFWGLYHAALANRMTAVHPRSGAESVGAAARRGMGLVPASILCVPVEEAQEAVDALTGPLPNLRMIVPVGPPPDAALRIRLAERGAALAGRPVRVQAVWAPELSRVLYGEAPTGPDDPPEATFGLITYPDLELLEVVEPSSLRPVEPGDPGHLVVTSIGWRGTALVRAATGSWVGGLTSGTVHPTMQATVPRLAPAAVDGAWMPRVSTPDGPRRADLTRAMAATTPWIAKLGDPDWSLGPAHDRLILAVDLESAPDAALINACLDDLADHLGVRPELRLDPDLAARRPRIARAGASAR